MFRFLELTIWNYLKLFCNNFFNYHTKDLVIKYWYVKCMEISRFRISVRHLHYDAFKSQLWRFNYVSFIYLTLAGCAIKQIIANHYYFLSANSKLMPFRRPFGWPDLSESLKNCIPLSAVPQQSVLPFLAHPCFNFVISQEK